MRQAPGQSKPISRLRQRQPPLRDRGGISPDIFPLSTRVSIKYVQVNGRTKIAVDNVISDYIPNPTFEVVARPALSATTSAE